MRTYKIPSPFTYRTTPTPPDEKRPAIPGKYQLEPLATSEAPGILKDVNRALLTGKIDKCDVVISNADVTDPQPGKIYLRKINNRLVYTAITEQGKIIKNRTLQNISAPEPFDMQSIELHNLKQNILKDMSKSGYTPKVPTLFDLKADDLNLTAHQKKLYQTPEDKVNTYDQSKVANIMMPMLDTMTEQDARQILKKLKTDLIELLSEHPESKSANKIISKENRDSAAKLVRLLEAADLDNKSAADAKKMLKSILQQGKVNDLTLSPLIAKRCARLLLNNYKAIITERVKFTEDANGLNAFKKFLGKHLLSTAPEDQRDFLADNIARNMHQSGAMYGTLAYFHFKFFDVFTKLFSSEPQSPETKFVSELSDPQSKTFTLGYDKDVVTFKSTASYSEILTSGKETKHGVIKGGGNFAEIDSTLYLSVKPNPDQSSAESLTMELTSDPLTIRKTPLGKNGKRVPFLNNFFALLCDDPLSAQNGIYLLDHKPETKDMKEMATYLYFEGRTLKYRVKDVGGAIDGIVPTHKLNIDSLMKIANENNGQNDIRSLAEGMSEGNEKKALISLAKVAKALEEPAPKKNSGFLGFIRRAWSSGEPEKKKQPEKKMEEPARTMGKVP